jgi:peptide/nickel transport system permease protein
MLIVSIVVFLLLYITPGDPAAMILGTQATPEQLEGLRHEMGLDQPAHVQLIRWMGRLIHGDLGESIFLDRPVTQAIQERVEPTVLLTLLATVFAVSLGLPLGIISAVRRGTWFDFGAILIGMLGISIPAFWVGLILILLFAVQLEWLPVAGYKTIAEGSLWESLRYLILPAVTLGFGQGAFLARMTRSTMLEVLNEDYIRTARAKGLAERVTVIRHALRNALVPLVTVIGLTVAILLAGAVVVEVVFNIPGMGRLLVQAVLRRDFPLVQGAVLVVAVTYLVINLTVDIVYGIIDPRVRQG